MRALLDALTGPGGPVSVTGEIAWRRRPALYREHALFVTVSPDQAREQLACGARVIMAGHRRGVRRAGADHRGAGRAGAATAVRGGSAGCGKSSPRTPPRYGWPLWPGYPGCPRTWSPGGRSRSWPRCPMPPGRPPWPPACARSKARPLSWWWRWPPGPGNRPRCPATLSPRRSATWPPRHDDHRVGVPPEADAGSGWLWRAARAARSPWVAPWRPDGQYGPSYLLDLACARECAQADAVGHTGSGYAYVTSLDPALARPEFFSPDGSGPGPRLFSVSHKELSALTTRALVYGDIDLNLIDGSAIWLQSVTQALAAAGCEVTLVLKAAVRTSRLIDPLLAEPGVIVRRPFEEQLLEGPGPVPAAAAPELLARLDAGTRYDLVVLRGRAVTAAAAKSGAFAGRLWPYLTDVPQSVPGLTSAAAEELGMIAATSRYVLCQTEELRCFLEGSIPAACGKCVLLPPILAADPRLARGAPGLLAAAAGLHRQVRPALEHAGDDRAARPAGRAGRGRRTAHDRRQDPQRPRRLPAADAGRAGGHGRDLGGRAFAGGRDAARGVLRYRAGLASPRAGREPGAVDQGPGVRRHRAAGHPQPHPHARRAARRRLPAVRREPGRCGRGSGRGGSRSAAVPAGGRRDRPGGRGVHPGPGGGAAARIPRPGACPRPPRPAARRPARPGCGSWWPGTT